MPEDAKAAETQSRCDRAAQTIQHIRTNHPDIPSEGIAGIWFLMTMNQCGPLPPPPG